MAAGDTKGCCSALYEHPAVRWLLGDELHPGGEATTRRALELVGVGAGERLLDVASGTGASAILAARELGCVVAGVDYGAEAVRGAQRTADAAGLCDQVGFIVGDAESLPYTDGAFDAVLCECSLSSFPDKPRAIAEIRRVLRPGGRLALSDVVVDRDRLPEELGGALAAVACIGEALSRQGYEDLLAGAGLRPIAVEARDEDAAALAERVGDRLRGARLLGLDRASGSPVAAADAIGLVEAARRAIADSALGYAIFAASRDE
ncbi:MAG: methyltransferase domain-containing protein [Solirubrobacterales bacterium]